MRRGGSDRTDSDVIDGRAAGLRDARPHTHLSHVILCPSIRSPGHSLHWQRARSASQKTIVEYDERDDENHAKQAAVEQLRSCGAREGGGSGL